MESTYPKHVFNILDLLQQNGGSMLFTDILNATHSMSGTDTLSMLEFMITEKLISGKLASYERIRITPKGTAQLFAYREQLPPKAAKIESPIKSNDTTDNSPANTKNTKPNKKRKFSKKVNAITVAEILAIATALITLVAVVIDKFF